MLFFLSSLITCSGYHLDLHVLTPSCPSRRSTDLVLPPQHGQHQPEHQGDGDAHDRDLDGDPQAAEHVGEDLACELPVPRGRRHLKEGHFAAPNAVPARPVSRPRPKRRSRSRTIPVIPSAIAKKMMRVAPKVSIESAARL